MKGPIIYCLVSNKEPYNDADDEGITDGLQQSEEPGQWSLEELFFQK